MAETVKRPRELWIAFYLIIAGMLVASIEVVLDLLGAGNTYEEAAGGPVAYYLSIGLGITINVIFILLLMFRHNWARIVFIVLMILGILGSTPIVVKEFSEDLVGFTSSMLQTVLSVTALFFLMHKNTNAWYKKIKS